MPKLATNRAVWFVITGLASFWLLYGLIGRDALGEIASSLVLGTSAAIFIGWAAAMGAAFRRGASEAELSPVRTYRTD